MGGEDHQTHAPTNALLALPLELLLNILAQTQCKRSVGRFGCCSRQCRHVCDRGGLVWAGMLAQELSCSLSLPALRGMAPKEALRRWSTQSSWTWSTQKLATVSPDDPVAPPPKRFLQRAACVRPPPNPAAPAPADDAVAALALGGAPAVAPTAALLFGGSSQDPRAHHSTYFNDTWQVQLEGKVLRRVEQCGARPPRTLARSVSAPGTRHENELAAAAVRGLSAREQIPAPRTAFSLTAVGHRLFLFGGHTLTNGASMFTDDLWEAEVHFERDDAAAGEQLHSPRKDPAAVVEPIVRLVEWRRLGPNPTGRDEAEDDVGDDGGGQAAAAAWPKHRQGHSATEMDCGIVLFGGSYPAMALNDTWILNPTRGTETDTADGRPWFVQVRPDGPAPLPRAGHSAVTVDKRHLLIFGGNTSESTLAPDLWCLDTAAGGRATFAWNEVAVRGQRPSARIGHSAVVLGQTVLIYGGRNLFQADEEEEEDEGRTDAGLTCGTVHTLNTATTPMCWSKVEPSEAASGEKPRLRTGHSAIAHPSGRGLIIIGGMQPANEVVLPCDTLCNLDVLGLEEPDEDLHAMTPAPA